MDSNLKGRTIIYTGAAGLIGSACAAALAREGAHLALVDTAKDRLEALKHQILAESPDANILAFDDIDLCSAKSLDHMLTQVVRRFGKIDGLVTSHYPRTQDWGAKFEAIEFESWRHNVDSHLNSYFLVSQRTALHMMAKQSGSIVNFSSIYGLVGPDFGVYSRTGDAMTMPAAYAAIKGGISNLTRYLASYLGPQGIRVNAICPGGVFDQQHPEFVRNYTDRVPQRRMATVADVVGPLLFLLSDLASYVNGVNLPVDGGWTAI